MEPGDPTSNKHHLNCGISNYKPSSDVPPSLIVQTPIITDLMSFAIFLICRISWYETSAIGNCVLSVFWLSIMWFIYLYDVVIWTSLYNNWSEQFYRSDDNSDENADYQNTEKTQFPMALVSYHTLYISRLLGLSEYLTI